MKLLSALLLGLALFDATASQPLIGTPEQARQQQEQDQYWRQALDDFLNADSDAVINPYMQMIVQLNDTPSSYWCEESVQSMAKDAISLNPTSLLAYSILYNCAAMQHKTEAKAKHTATIDAIIRQLVGGQDAASIDSVIEIRELLEARLLLQAMDYTILDVNLVTRFGGIYYQYHVIDNTTGKVGRRYFSNLAFMKRQISNPNVSDDTAVQLLVQSYEKQGLDFALTAQAKRLIARRQYNEAEESLSKIGLYSPTANALYARIYQLTERFDELKALEPELLMDAKSGFSPSAISLAQAYATVWTDKPDAATKVQTLIDRIDGFSKPGEGAFQLALAIHLGAKEPHKANSIPWYEQAVANNHPKATLALADLYKQGRLVQKNDEKAFSLFTKAEAIGLDEAALEIAGYYHRGSETIEKDHSKEMAILERLAAKNNALALYILGQRYDKGGQVEVDKQKALDWYIKAWEAGEKRAANQIAILYETGEVNEKDGQPQMDLAHQWYEKGITTGERNAFSNLARLYRYGLGREVDLQKAANYYVKAAENGSATAYCNLADTMLLMDEEKYGKAEPDTVNRVRGLYEYGIRQNKTLCARGLAELYQKHLNDDDTARRYYELAVDSGDQTARKALEQLYFQPFVEQNYPEAITQLTKGMELDMPRPTYHLAQMYHQGLGVERDDRRALVLLRKALSLKYAQAAHAIALLYLGGQPEVRDALKAEKMLDHIASQSTENAVMVAQWFFYGDGTAVDYKLARRYYEMAGDESGTAINHLGEMYRYGWGVDVDMNKAIEYYQKAVAIDYPYGHQNLGELYYNGEGVGQDYTKAREWFAQAARLGLSHAQYYLGLIYQKGQGVEADYDKANLWFFKAMDNLHWGARFEIGKHMIQGLGMPSNPDKGRLLIVEAAEAGNEDAEAYLK